MRLGELLEATARTGRRAFVPLALIALVTALPLAALGALAVVALGDDGDPRSALDAEALPLVLLTVALGAIATAVAVLASARLAVAAHEGEEVRWQDSLREALPRVPAVLWVLLLIGAGLLVGFLLLVLPGIWLAVAWSLSITVMAIEDRRGTQALRRSFELVRGRWWTVFGLLLVVVLLASVVSGLVQAPFTALAGGLGARGDAGPATVDALGTLVASAVTSPFIAAAAAVLYVELRRRAAGGPPRPEAPDGWLPPAAGR